MKDMKKLHESLMFFMFLLSKIQTAMGALIGGWGL
jgi:hypothetical protein